MLQAALVGAGVVLLAVAAAASLARRRLTVVTVDGASMSPSLCSGDRVLVSRRTAGLAVGDVVVFRYASGADEKLIKLVALYCLYGLLDQAAETLVMFRDRLAGRLDVDRALDLLAGEAQAADPDLGDGGFQSHADYMAAYESDHPWFYGANRRRYEARVQPIIERDEARAERDAAHEALARARGELDEARGRLEAVTRSTSWRLTAPLRAVMRRLLGRG